MHLLFHKFFLKDWDCYRPLSFNNPLNNLINHVLDRLQYFFDSLNISYICPRYFDYLQLSFNYNLILAWNIDRPILFVHDLDFGRHIYCFALLDDLIDRDIAILSIDHWLFDMLD